LLTGIVVLALAAGGLTYRFVLRKPAVNNAPIVSGPGRLQPEPVAPSIPATQTQPPAQQEPTITTKTQEPASEDRGIVPTTPAPAKSRPTPPSAPALDLSGNWHGKYTNNDTNQVTKVNLQISENSADLLSGTLMFDPGGSNSGSCSLTGTYNSQTKFMLINIDNCLGRPPNYFQGNIGFSSVKPTDRQLLGVDSLHNCWLDISRQ
jgi:hypothetical protein